MPPPFATEINAMIFDELKALRADGTLAACALVCSSWRPFALKSLYRSLDDLFPMRSYNEDPDPEKWKRPVPEYFPWSEKLVKPLHSESIGSLVREVGGVLSRDFGNCKPRVKMPCVAEEIEGLLPHLPNCKSVCFHDLHHLFFMDILVATVCSSRKPLENLNLHFSRLGECGIGSPSLTNLPRYLWKRQKLESLQNLRSLTLHNFTVPRVFEDFIERRKTPTKDELKGFRPLPSWSLSSLEMVKCRIVPEEYPFLIGKPQGKLERLHAFHCGRTCFVKDLTSLVRTHSPSTGLRSLSLVQVPFLDDHNYRKGMTKEPLNTTIEDLIKLCPTLVNLHLEGYLYCGPRFLSQSVPDTLVNLRVIPYDRVSFPGETKRRWKNFLDDIFPPGFSPSDWCNYIVSPRSRCLCRLSVGRSYRWTVKEEDRIVAAAHTRPLALDISDPLIREAYRGCYTYLYDY